MRTASKLWDLLHEVAPFVPVAQVELHERVQSALDAGFVEKADFGTCMTFWTVQEWDGIQGKYQTLKRKCSEQEAMKLREQYQYAGKTVRVLEVSQYQTELS